MPTHPPRDQPAKSTASATRKTSARKPAGPQEIELRPPVPLAQWPDKTLLRISEVAQLIGVAAHVVRFWTSQFGAVRPERSSSGRLLFGRPAAERLLRIRAMLYEQGLTIAGARKALGAVVEKPKPMVVAEPTPHLLAQIERLQTELRGVQAREAAARAGEAQARLEAAAARKVAAAIPQSDQRALSAVITALERLAAQLDLPPG